MLYRVNNASCRALNCRWGCYFCLDTKVTKRSSHQKCFFALLAFALQISQNHGLLNLTSTSFAQIPASARFANAPATAQATIVLPAFVRSCSADGGKVPIRRNFPSPLSAAGEERGVQRSADGVSRLRDALTERIRRNEKVLIPCSQNLYSHSL